MFSKQLNEKLNKYHLLKHPFYKAWNEGKLTREVIKDYAEQYYQHVKAFPRYISATHSLCEDIQKRKILFEFFVEILRFSENCQSESCCCSTKSLQISRLQTWRTPRWSWDPWGPHREEVDYSCCCILKCIHQFVAVNRPCSSWNFPFFLGAFICKLQIELR